ncbi:hypothetical protein D3C75_259650 [compost metagenome]
MRGQGFRRLIFKNQGRVKLCIQFAANIGNHPRRSNRIQTQLREIHARIQMADGYPQFLTDGLIDNIFDFSSGAMDKRPFRHPRRFLLSGRKCGIILLRLRLHQVEHMNNIRPGRGQGSQKSSRCCFMGKRLQALSLKGELNQLAEIRSGSRILPEGVINR